MQTWQDEFIFHDGDQFFSHLTHALNAAQKTIDLETYIFDRDHLGMEMLEALSHAASRGVRVRILLDGLGCSKWSYRDAQISRMAGVAVRFFHPLPWQNKRSHILRFFRLRRILLGVWKLNRRNHRKTCVIDHQIAFLGGMNISARHLKKETGKKAWRDTSVRVSGHAVSDLAQAFEYAWNHPRSLRNRWKRYLKVPAYPHLVRLNMVHRQRKAAYRDLIHRISTAKTRVWITNPYFVPPISLIRALRMAAGRKMDVRLLFSEKNDILGMKWAIHAFYFILLEGGIRIFEYQSSFLHAKIMLIDSWATVGSSNLNQRSFLHDLEVDVVLNHSSSVKSIENQYLTDLVGSHEIDQKVWKHQPITEKILSKFVLIFKRWL